MFLAEDVTFGWLVWVLKFDVWLDFFVSVFGLCVLFWSCFLLFDVGVCLVCVFWFVVVVSVCVVIRVFACLVCVG